MIFTLNKADKYGMLVKHTYPQDRLGENFCDNDDNRRWVYVRADEGLSKGAALAAKASNQIASGLLATAADTNKLVFNGVNLDTVFPRVPNQPKFNDFIMVQEVGGSQIGTVYAHSGTEMWVDWWSELERSLSSPLAASANLNFVVPWLVQEAAQTGDVIGFAQREIAVGEYFWALVEGCLLYTSPSPRDS